MQLLLWLRFSEGLLLTEWRPFIVFQNGPCFHAVPHVPACAVGSGGGAEIRRDSQPPDRRDRHAQRACVRERLGPGNWRGSGALEVVERCGQAERLVQDERAAVHVLDYVPPP